MTKYMCTKCGNGPLYDLTCKLETAGMPDRCPFKSKKNTRSDFVVVDEFPEEPDVMSEDE